MRVIYLGTVGKAVNLGAAAALVIVGEELLVQ